MKKLIALPTSLKTWKGGIFENKEVVVDGNLVTSRYPGDLLAFMRETIRVITKIKK